MRLFDFDGVIGSAFEEALFTMPRLEGHDEFISWATEEYGFNAPGESYQSLRYMLLQRLLWEVGEYIRPGPLFDKVSEGEPFMVITARSDLYAVRRMLAFLDYHDLQPIRVLHVGSASKSVSVRMLMEALPSENFEFYDDNMKHIKDVAEIFSGKISTFHVDNDMEPVYVEATSYFNDLIQEHMR